MNCFQPVIAIVICMLAGCAGPQVAPIAKAPATAVKSPPPRPKIGDPDQIVKVQARVQDYKHAAMWDHYEGGGFAVFDAVEFKLSAPAEWKGHTFTVYGQRENTKLWISRKGTRYSFEVERKYLLGSIPNPDGKTHNSYQLFVGGLQNLKKIE